MQIFYLKDKEQLLSRIKFTLKLRLFFIVAILSVIPIISYLLKLGEIKFLRITLILLIWIIGIFIFDQFIKQKKLSVKEIENIYLIGSSLEYFLFIILSYFLGGIGWIGFFYGSIMLVFVFLCTEPKKAFIFSFYVILITGLFFYLEFKNIIPHQKVFEFDPSKNIAYLLTTFIAFAGFVLAVALNLFNFSSALNKKSQEIMNVYNEIETLKNTLEIRVEARKKELEELVKGLDSEVKRKTKELQKRIEELEDVNKKIIERELEMIKIKREIKSIKKEHNIK